VIPALEAAVREAGLEFCDVEGFGELAYAELEGSKKGVPQRINGPLTLLSVRGRTRRAGGIVLSEFVCTLSRQIDSGIEVLGGRLLGGLATVLELRLHPLCTLDDALSDDDEVFTPPVSTPPRPAPVVERREVPGRALTEVQAATSPKALTAQELANPSPRSDAMGAGWAEVFAESQRLRRAAAADGVDDELEEDEDHRPERGDYVEHRQFGRCRVIRIDDDHMALKKPDGRIVQLGLQILQFRLKGEAEGKPVYEAVVKPR
jgi:hypothetical protein